MSENAAVPGWWRDAASLGFLSGFARGSVSRRYRRGISKQQRGRSVRSQHSQALSDTISLTTPFHRQAYGRMLTGECRQRTGHTLY